MNSRLLPVLALLLINFNALFCGLNLVDGANGLAVLHAFWALALSVVLHRLHQSELELAALQAEIKASQQRHLSISASNPSNRAPT